MTLIKWSSSFTTGIPSVDHEHAELVALINRLHAEISRGAHAAVAEFLGELHDAIAAHFALEEKIMRDHAYAGFPAHKADHERLLDEIRDIMEEHEHGRFPDLAATLAPRLETWFSRHFQTLDAQLHQAFGQT